MIFLSLLLTLGLEQYRALPQDNLCYRLFAAWSHLVERLFFAGKKSHAYLVWALIVLLPSVLVFWVYTVLAEGDSWFWQVLTLVFSVSILYFCLGFRQFSGHFSAIQKALLNQDNAKAQELLALALGRSKQDWTAQNMASLLMQASVPAAHIHILGVVVVYALTALLGFGPSGAVLYRLAYFAFSQSKTQSALMGVNPESKTKIETILADHVFDAGAERSRLLQALCARAWYWINWLPVYATVLVFAAVGNFENTIGTWRSMLLKRGNTRNATEAVQAQETLLLRAASASLSVNYSPMDWGDGLQEEGNAYRQQEWPLIQPQHLQNLAALGWRALLFWLFIAFVIAIAHALP